MYQDNILPPSFDSIKQIKEDFDAQDQGKFNKDTYWQFAHNIKFETPIKAWRSTSNGKYSLVIEENSSVHIYDVIQNKVVASFTKDEAPRTPASVVSPCPIDKYLFVGSREGHIFIYDIDREVRTKEKNISSSQRYSDKMKSNNIRKHTIYYRNSG